jgi:hypothetical protein
VAAAIPLTATLLGSACVVAGIAAWFAAHKLPLALAALSLPVASVPVVGLGLMQTIGEDRSAQQMAEAIENTAGSRAEVVGVAAFPLSLPFYLGRTVTLSTHNGAELTSNYAVQHIAHFRARRGTTLRDGDWWQESLLDCRDGQVFVTQAGNDAAIRRLQQRLPLMLTTRKYAVFGPCRRGMLLGAAGGP